MPSIEYLSSDNIPFKQKGEKKKIDEIKLQRNNRLLKKKETQIKNKIKQVNEKLAEYGIIAKDNEKDESPKDYEFEFGFLNKNIIDSPKLGLPIQTDDLFVYKPIDKYEPIIKPISNAFIHNPQTKSRKKFSSEPKSHLEIRDCSCELSGEKLQKIFASPTIIDFGPVFIKSKEIRTFAIKNELRY